MAAENEKRVKKYAWIAALGSLVVGTIVPMLLKWALAIVTGVPLP